MPVLITFHNEQRTNAEKIMEFQRLIITSSYNSFYIETCIVEIFLDIPSLESTTINQCFVLFLVFIRWWWKEENKKNWNQETAIATVSFVWAFVTFTYFYDDCNNCMQLNEVCIWKKLSHSKRNNDDKLWLKSRSSLANILPDFFKNIFFGLQKVSLNFRGF